MWFVVTVVRDSRNLKIEVTEKLVYPEKSYGQPSTVGIDSVVTISLTSSKTNNWKRK